MTTPPSAGIAAPPAARGAAVRCRRDALPVRGGGARGLVARAEPLPRPPGHRAARLAEQVDLAIVSSSAAERVRACLQVTGLSTFFGPDRIFSSETSLPRPTGTQDPAVHAFACAELGVDPRNTIAVEDSVNGVRSAAAAGCWTIGTLQYTPVDERPARAAALRAAGAAVVLDGWTQIAALLAEAPAPRIVPPPLSEPA